MPFSPAQTNEPWWCGARRREEDGGVKLQHDRNVWTSTFGGLFNVHALSLRAEKKNGKRPARLRTNEDTCGIREKGAHTFLSSVGGTIMVALRCWEDRFKKKKQLRA